MDCGSTIFIFLALIQAICGQTVTGPSAVQQGSDTVYICTGVPPIGTFTWTDFSADPSVLIFTGADRSHAPAETKYDNFNVLVSENEGTSTMTISNTAIEDEGTYRCIEGQGRDDAELKVEVKGTWSVSPEGPVKSNINDKFEVTCEAVGGRPNETITWMLDDGPSPCDDTVVTYPAAGEGLFSTTSICTFQATSEKNGKTLKCVIIGHELSNLNGEVTTTLDTHSAPIRADIMTVEIQFLDPSYRVLCNISEADQPNPRIRNYYIYSDDTLIHQSSTGVNFVDVPESDYDLSIVFNCVAGNYLGNTTTFDPPSTTTLTPTTMAEHTTEGNTATMPGSPATEPPTTSIIPTGTPVEDPKVGGLSTGAKAGIAVGCILCVVIIVVIVLFLLKPECCPCFAGSGTPPPSNKPSGRAVGSSNGSGSEKDVESPLNGVKDVTAEEKLPQAAPRGHGSIQHTNDNPDQAMYAMVDKKPARGGGGAGDAPDRGSGPGQNEPQGMLYADLDLSHKAGHTDKHVPKNENDVVVYSSILV